MNKFISEEKSLTLKLLNLNSFQSLWDLPIEWFEEPNFKRGGWSGVARVEFSLESSQPLVLFIKKQSNFSRFSIKSPFKKVPTFRREFHRLQFLKNHGINVPNVIFYGEALKGGVRAILVTEALQGFVPLDSIEVDWLMSKSKTYRANFIESIADALRRFHETGLVHRALHPKHIFIKVNANKPEVALIDMEKSRYASIFYRRAIEDLKRLNRYMDGYSRSVKLNFFKSYFGINNLATHPLGSFYKFLCRRILESG